MAGMRREAVLFREKCNYYPLSKTRPYHEGIIQFPRFQAPLEKHAKQDHYNSWFKV